MSNWILVEGIKQTFRRFRSEASDLPRAAWKRWGLVILLGWLAAAGLTLFITIAGQRMANAGFFDGKAALLQTIADTFPVSPSLGIFMAVPGDTIFLVTVTILATLIALWRGYPMYAATILAALFMSDLLIGVGWFTWNRPRPELLYDGLLAPGLHSFPSGHVLQAVAVYGLFAYLWMHATRNWAEKILAFLLWILLIGLLSINRLVLGVHWPSDVIAAIPMGLAWLVVLILALRVGRRAAAKAES